MISQSHKDIFFVNLRFVHCTNCFFSCDVESAWKAFAAFEFEWFEFFAHFSRRKCKIAGFCEPGFYWIYALHIKGGYHRALIWDLVCSFFEHLCIF